ncbi:hypothetical protein ACSRUE_38810 [Sorangium sp. KYC3313]|uniref:hypothetical protein n=1 Tax=Sorangium sp. KYC3313 TaxID=3449740 RepID=UPI003F8B46E5
MALVAPPDAKRSPRRPGITSNPGAARTTMSAQSPAARSSRLVKRRASALSFRVGK